MKMNSMQCKMKRLQGEIDVTELYCQQLITENERYKSKYEAELEANNISSDKLERAQAKIEKLESSLLKSQNLLSATEIELALLREPQVSYLLV